MKMIKRITAVLLIALVALSVCACHPKNEIAVKIGDVEFTSAYYACALIEADLAAKQKVDENLADDTKVDKTDGTYYYSQKIDKKDFVTYVKEQAIEKLKEIAAYKTKCDENKLKIKDEEETTIKAYADYYWTSYGYQQVYEPNGVSKETFIDFMRGSYYSGVYFNSIYGKDGKEEIKEDDIKSFMSENYLIADVLDVDFAEKTDDEKTAAKEKFEKYEADLKSGSMTFDEAYTDFNGEAQSEEPEVTDGSAPKDKKATLMGSDKTSNANDNYATVKDMAVGEVKLVEKKDNGGYTLFVKKDIMDDDYYLTNLDEAIRHDIKDDDFNKEIETFMKTLKVTKNNKAIKLFNVKKLVYPQANSQA